MVGHLERGIKATADLARRNMSVASRTML